MSSSLATLAPLASSSLHCQGPTVMPDGSSTGEREHTPARDGLQSFLSRLLGWENAPAVDRALRSIERTMAQRAQLVLWGDGDLVPIAHALHRRMLGSDRPFIVGDPRRGDTPASARSPANYASGVAAFGAAVEGSLCVRSKRPPRDFASVMELLQCPSARVRLVVCADRHERNDVLLAVSAPIQVPSLGTRARDLPRIVEEYAADAIMALASPVSFTSRDRDWVAARCASSLHEIETATMRLIALRQAGNILQAAKLLGMSHSSLSQWFASRRPARFALVRSSPPAPRNNRRSRR